MVECAEKYRHTVRKQCFLPNDLRSEGNLIMQIQSYLEKSIF